MPRVRKRPLEVEAIQVVPKSPLRDDKSAMWWIGLAVQELPPLLDDEGNLIPGPDLSAWTFASDHIVIPTLEGDHRADIDDWIIRGVKGEFYPCKPDIFAKTYEELPDGDVSAET